MEALGLEGSGSSIAKGVEKYMPNKMHRDILHNAETSGLMLTGSNIFHNADLVVQRGLKISQILFTIMIVKSVSDLSHHISFLFLFLFLFFPPFFLSFLTK